MVETGLNAYAQMGAGSTKYGMEDESTQLDTDSSRSDFAGPSSK